MSYEVVAMLLIAPLISAASIDQKKPDAGVKKGAIQADGSRKQGNPNEKHAPEKAADAICNGCSVQEPATQTQKQDTYDPKKDTLYRTYLWFTIGGVLIALGGIGVLLRQNGQIRTQTEHLERQINIQQRSSRQWLNLLEWRQRPAEGMNQTIRLSFQIENPTKVPLWLDHVRCSVGGQHQDSMLGTFLAPDNPFPHEFYASLNQPDWTSYNQGSGVVLEVEISLFFTDAFDNQWNQIFQRALFCQGDNILQVRESRTIMRRSEPDQRENRTRRTD